MSARSDEPWVPNIEGAPRVMYEVWSRQQRETPSGTVYWPGAGPWIFIGYRVLSLRQVLKYQEFGYHVERSRSGDRRDLVPLFPRLDSAEEDPGDGLDPVPVPEP